jgi:hypothetical protein
LLNNLLRALGETLRLAWARNSRRRRAGKISEQDDRHPRDHLDRRLTVLLHLNSQLAGRIWGYLELLDRDMTGCIARDRTVVHTRLVVFATTDFSYHEHPDTLI